MGATRRLGGALGPAAALGLLALMLGDAAAAGRAHRRRPRPDATAAPAATPRPATAPAANAAPAPAEPEPLAPQPLVDPLGPVSPMELEQPAPEAAAPAEPERPAPGARPLEPERTAPPAPDPQPASQPPADPPGPKVPVPRDEPLPPLRQRVGRYDRYHLRARLSLPFKGAWTAYNATPGARNTHYLNANQRFAVDWLVSRAGSDGRRRTCRGRCRDNGDFYAYGQDVLAPADGEVLQVVDGVPDNRPGQVDVYFRLGNTVVLALGQGEYAFLSHLQPGSLAVRPGDRVRRGQRIGRCGNSGNSSEPHLHMQVTDSPLITQAASMPLWFQRVQRNGAPEDEATPQSGDEFAPAP